MRRLLIAIIFAFACTSLHATPVTYARAGGSGDLYVPGPNITVNSSESVSDMQTDGSKASASYQEPHAMVEAEATLGVIRISAQAVRTPTTSGSSGFYVFGDDAGGRGYYMDEFTISGGTGQDTASIGVIVDGSIQTGLIHDPNKFSGGVSILVNQDPDGLNTPIIYPGMPVTQNPAYNSALGGKAPTPGGETFFGAYPAPILQIVGAIGEFSFVYDVPFTLKVEVAVSAILDTAESTSMVTMDFFNTANTLFNLPNGAVLSSTSGTVYDVIGVQNPNPDPSGDPTGNGVPVPAVVPLMVIGALGMRLGTRRVRHVV